MKVDYTYSVMPRMTILLIDPMLSINSSTLDHFYIYLLSSSLVGPDFVEVFIPFDYFYSVFVEHTFLEIPIPQIKTKKRGTYNTILLT